MCAWFTDIHSTPEESNTNLFVQHLGFYEKEALDQQGLYNKT